MSYQKCPICNGTVEDCPICNGERIIDEANGLPPSKNQQVVSGFERLVEFDGKEHECKRKPYTESSKNPKYMDTWNEETIKSKEKELEDIGKEILLNADGVSTIKLNLNHPEIKKLFISFANYAKSYRSAKDVTKSFDGWISNSKKYEKV
jgi:hypothetical protein